MSVQVGDRYNMLVVKSETTLKYKDGSKMWLCLCDCGKEKLLPTPRLTNLKTKSCGCLRHRAYAKKHGEVVGGKITPEDRAWIGIRNRCKDARNKTYGGRGIKICEEWDKSFDAFLAYVGRRPAQGYSIDRIDNNGNYEPGNVRWADRTTQTRNRSSARTLTLNGETQPLIIWANKLGIRFDTLHYRIAKGWTEDMLQLPVSKGNAWLTRRKNKDGIDTK